MRAPRILLVIALLACQSRATADARPVGAAPAPPPIGTAHQIDLIRVATDGHWIAICQARRDTDDKLGIEVTRSEEGHFLGDAMTPYLVRGGGEGVAIDSFVAASHDDRWLVIVRARTLVLLDTMHEVEQVLPDADVRGEAAGRRKVVAFDDRDEHVVYVRKVGDQSRVVIRTLATGQEIERSIDGDVWEVEEQPTTGWLHVTRVLRTEARGGYVAWPHLISWRLVGEPCIGGSSVHDVFGSRGSSPPEQWLQPETGELRDDRPPAIARDPRVRATFGANLLLSDADAFRILNVQVGAVIALPEIHGFVTQAGAMVEIGNTIVDLATARVLGAVPEGRLAIDSAGRALVPSAVKEPQISIGPLRWVAPTPAR